MTSEHRRHDRLLVTRFAAGDSYPTERDEAEALVARCSECAALAADIRLLSTRTSRLPAPRRPRDFRISAEQAERLRGSWFDRFMRGLAAPGWGATLRPVAGAAMAIGLTLVAVGAFPMIGAPAGGSAGVDRPIEMTVASEQPDIQPMATAGDNVAAPGDVATPDDPSVEVAPGGEPGEGLKGPAGPETLDDAYLETPAPAAAAADGGERSTVESQSIASSNDLLLLVVGALIAALSAVTLGVTWFARRRFGDGLLR